jgi:uncharacterized repeat protein (TIGR03899 family)
MEINDLAGVKEPLAKLMESISNAAGVIYEPTRIRRKAKADAEAMLTLADAEIKVEELKRRADERITHTELRRQRNIEQIVGKAVMELPKRVEEKPADEDWITQFFNLSQDVGDADMQVLWGRILAGEVARPGTYSLRTLQTVKVLSKRDAQLFSQYCSYVWQLPGGDICRYTTRATGQLLANKGMGAAERQHLQNIGLLYGSGLMSDSGSQTTVSSNDVPFEVVYFGRRYLVSHVLCPKESALLMPEFLTDIGAELFPISGALPDEQYLQTLIETLRNEDKLEVKLLD